MSKPTYLTPAAAMKEARKLGFRWKSDRTVADWLSAWRVQDRRPRILFDASGRPELKSFRAALAAKVEERNAK